MSGNEALEAFSRIAIELRTRISKEFSLTPEIIERLIEECRSAIPKMAKNLTQDTFASSCRNWLAQQIEDLYIREFDKGENYFRDHIRKNSTISREDEDEVLNDCRFKIVRNIRDLDLRGFKGWCKTACKNLAIDKKRKIDAEKRKPENPIEVYTETFDHRELDPLSTSIVNETLMELSEDERNIVFGLFEGNSTKGNLTHYKISKTKDLVLTKIRRAFKKWCRS